MRAFIVLFLVSLSIHTQTKAEPRIDSLLEASLKQYKDFNSIASLKTANEAREQSIKQDYRYGFVKSNLFMAKVLLDVGAYNKALAYIKEAEKSPDFEQNTLMKIESYRLKGRLYGDLKIYNLSIELFRKQLLLSKEIKDETQRNLSVFMSIKT